MSLVQLAQMRTTAVVGKGGSANASAFADNCADADADKKSSVPFARRRFLIRPIGSRSSRPLTYLPG